MMAVVWLMIRWILMIVLIILLMTLVEYKAYEGRYKRGSSEQMWKWTMGEVFFVLSRMGYEIDQGETLFQYMKRLQMRFLQEEELLQEIFELYNWWRYGKMEEIQGEAIKMTALCRQFIQRQEENNGRLKSLWWQIRYRVYDYRKV